MDFISVTQIFFFSPVNNGIGYNPFLFKISCQKILINHFSRVTLRQIQARGAPYHDERRHDFEPATDYSMHEGLKTFHFVG